MAVVNACTALMYLAFEATTFAAGGGPVPLVQLAQADLVGVAAVTSVTEGAVREQQVQLRFTSILRGQTTSTSVTATLAPPAGLRGPAGPLQQGVVGQLGVWFLNAAANGYQVLPVFDNPILPREVFIPVLSASPPAASGASLQQQVLSYEVASYEAIANPSPRDDFQLMSAIVGSSAGDGTTAAASLMASASPLQHLMGMAASIRLGSSAAVAEVADELDTLKSSPKFGHIISTLEAFPGTRDSETVAGFQKLIALHSEIPGLDRAVSTAFVHIANAPAGARSPLPTNAVLPGMILLLDSTDANTQIRAARFLGYFALFADATGNIPGTGITGPFASADTRQYTPANGSTLTPAQYAGYWKVWWAQNKAALGY